MSNPEILKEFWYDLTDEQRNNVLNNCHEEYDKFLQGKEFNVEVVKRFIEIDDKKLIGYITSGNLQMFKKSLILKKQCDIQLDYYLKWASSCNRLDIVKYLIELGANIYADDNIALRWADENGNTEIVEYLKSLS